MPVVQVVAIVPKGPFLNVNDVRLQLLNAFRKAGTRIKRDNFERTTETWRQKPEFLVKVSLSRGSGPSGVVVWTGNAIYRYLDEGTRVRWAVMSRDWRSKTTPRFIGSGPGAGRVVIRGRRAMIARGIGPRPGIQGREWTLAIGQAVEKWWPAVVQAAINRGLARAQRRNP